MKNPSLIVLFGSQAAGTAGKQSDTDVAVLADAPLSFEERTEIGERVARELHVSEDSLDIVDLHVASPLLQYQVAERGKLIDGTRENFVRFRVLAWKRYHDTARLRRARERSLAKKIYAI
jgi:predicted nucleotidyltransferase